MDYELVFIVLAFCLSGIFAKDSTGGITELTLSSKCGRKVNPDARWIAGNLFAASIFLIYLAVQLIVNGLIGTLAGWNMSAQMMWFTCLYNMTFGEGLLIKFGGGLLGALVVGNLVMLVSMKLKNVKLAAVLSVIAIVLILRMENLRGIKKLFTPVSFVSDDLFERYLFMGNIAVPYFAVVIALTVLYVAILRIGVKLSYKKYHIN